MQTRLVLATLVLAALVVPSCSDNDLGPEVTGFTATLSSANEVPTNTSTATGTATFSVVPGGMLYHVDVTGIDSAIAAHIHSGAVGVNGPVVVTLFAGPATGLGFTGTLAAGAAGAPTGMTLDSVLVLMRSGNAYVNVHTRLHPGGEIRGQVAKQ